MSETSSSPPVTDQKKRFQMRLGDEDNNPCLKEANISRKCLEKYSYNHDKCAMEYDNYNKCKQFWGKVRSERRTAGIKPHLPPKEERDKIVELKKKGINVNSVR